MTLDSTVCCRKRRVYLLASLLSFLLPQAVIPQNHAILRDSRPDRVEFNFGSNELQTGFLKSVQGSVNQSIAADTWAWQNPLPQGNVLEAAQYLSGTNIVAAGYAGTILRSTDAGTNWTVQHYVGNVQRDFYGLHFLDASTGMAVGSFGTIAKTTDGGLTWTSQSSGTTNYLRGVRVLSTTNAIAVGAGGMIVRTTNGGSTWSTVTSGTTNDLLGSGFVDVNAGFAVGRNGTILKTTTGGASWTVQSSPTSRGLWNVHFVTSTVAYAVGDTGVIIKTTDGGTTWATQTSGVTTNLRGVHFSDVLTGYAVGWFGIILKTTNGGSSWTSLSSGTQEALIGTNFVSSTSGIAVGDAGTLLLTGNGSTWTNRLSGNTWYLRSVSFSDNTTGFAAGGNGTILKTTNSGSSWTTLSTGTTNDLWGIHAISSTVITAVGNAGTIIRSTNGGTSWAAQSSGTSTNLRGVQFIDTNTGTVIGQTGLILRTTNGGTTWSSQVSGTSTNLYGISFVDANTGTVTGNAGVILRTTNGGSTWTAQTSGTTNDIWGVYAFSSTNAIAVGVDILRTTNGGSTWTAITNPTTDFLTKVAFYDANNGIAVGDNGTVVRTTNGGTTWATERSNTGNVLYALAPHSGGGFTVVGDHGNILRSTPSTPSGAPSITSLTPTSGAVGTSVTISGTNFSATPSSNIVYFGAVRATVTSASATSLTVTVPTGATYAPVSVTVGGLTTYSRLPFVVTFAGGTISTSAFATKVDFTAGSAPNGLASADFDADGKADIAAVNTASFAISLFRNTSSAGSITAGSLTSAGSLSTGDSPREISVADLDGDGKLDIAVANQGSFTVTLFRNTSTSGSISFSNAGTVATRNSPLSVAIGDIDGDGKPELVVPSSASDTVSVYRNLSTVGSISFAPAVHFPTGATPHSAVVADFDGDGKSDVAVSNNAAGTISVYRNTSTTGSITTSSLAAPVTFPAAANPAHLVAGDVDGDSKLDIVVSNTGSAVISVLRNTSTSGSITTSSFATKVDFPAGTNPLGISLGDVDGDGKIDIIVANVNSNTFSLYKNNSTSGSISLSTQVTFGTGTGPAYSSLSDVDGDGRLDAIVTNGTSATVSVLRNTTVTAPGTAPTLSSPANGATGQSTTVSFSWGSVSGASKYHFQLSTSSVFSTLVVDSPNVSTTSTQVSGLSGGTTYYWRVRAGNSEGYGPYSSTFGFTTGTVPSAPTLSSPANGATGQSTSITFSWTASSGATSYRFQLATTSGFVPTVLDTPIASTSILISTLAYNTTYYWRVAGVNSFGTGSYSASRTFTTTGSYTVSTPTTVHSFPSSPSQTNYRLFGMVGTSQLPFSNFVSGAQGTDYRIYADNGASTNFLVEQNASNTMQVGKGYWILKKTTLSVNSGSYPMPQLTSDGTYSISVTPNAWNLITNPFDRAVTWSRVLSANGLASNTNLWGWSGSWAASTTLQPYIGYYFFNSSTTLTSLKIPYPFTASVQEPDPLPLQWKVSMKLEGMENIDEGNFIGVAEQASEGLDDYDMRKPPLFGDLGYLYFVRTEWDEKFPRFSSDVRPTIGDGQVWNFEARNERGSKSKLQFTGIDEIPAEYEVMLVNLYNSEPIDLRKISEYSFTAVSEKMPFRLIVGTGEYVRQEVSKLIPSEFALEQNFPNPFNPSTSITFRVPTESNVRLEVINILGQVVAVLAEETYRPGTYTVVWNGRSGRGEPVASGVYFSRFIAGDRVVRVNKMLLMK
ncbi:MAG TPA: FG-GAP-like repeat-containing protein [Bacteroidota bacterium]|nr:FG-GAP-like repeat-containing protein [Bacteroidota bacterium]